MKAVRLYMQYDYGELIHRLRQFFIYEVCREETLKNNGEFRCETFSPRTKTETYLIQDNDTKDTIGYVLMTQNVVSIEHGWHINEILILPKYRNKGYGKLVINNIIDIHKCEKIELCPAENGCKQFWDKMKEYYNGYDNNGFVVLNNK